MHTARHAQRAKMIQKELGSILLSQTANLFGHAFISVTSVKLDFSGSVAKVYLSCSLHEAPILLWKQIVSQKYIIGKLLGRRIGHKVRKIPHLIFYMDNSVDQGARITALIDQCEKIS